MMGWGKVKDDDDFRHANLNMVCTTVVDTVVGEADVLGVVQDDLRAPLAHRDITMSVTVTRRTFSNIC